MFISSLQRGAILNHATTYTTNYTCINNRIDTTQRTVVAFPPAYLDLLMQAVSKTVSTSSGEDGEEGGGVFVSCKQLSEEGYLDANITNS